MMMKETSKFHPSFLCAVSNDALNRIGCYPSVSSEHITTKGVNAKEWVDFVIGKLGVGKGGGKADQANGSIPGGAELVDTILSLANEYITSKVTSSLVSKNT